jgi:hypothetical protein
MDSVLSPEELKAYKQRLEEWRPPKEFIKIVDELMSKVGGSRFFTDTGLAFGRDAWVGKKLASVCEADAVRLCPGLWPDYEERDDRVIAQFEITEAGIPGRRRGDEYKSASCTPQLKFDPGANWIARAEQVPGALLKASEAKAKKGYPPTDLSSI